MTNGFDHDLDLWMLKVKFDLWPHTWPWPWIFMVKFLNSCISEWEGRLTLHKGGGSRSFMTMTVTIWWPSSGVWIYQIVTGVTSVDGVPSTHLIVFLGHPSNFKVTWDQKSMILIRVESFWTVTAVWIHRWLRNDAQCLKRYSRGALLFWVICQISRSYGLKNQQFGSNVSISKW